LHESSGSGREGTGYLVFQGFYDFHDVTFEMKLWLFNSEFINVRLSLEEGMGILGHRMSIFDRCK